MKASIDIGSNSLLLLVGDVKSGKVLEKRSEARVTGLGKSLDKNNMFSKKAFDDSLLVLQEYREILDELCISPEHVIVTATEAMRVASNAQDFIEEVKRDLGFKITPISGEGEAYYTGLGVVSCFDREPTDEMIMDIGGASTEFLRVYTNPYELQSTVSLPIGSVRGTDYLREKTFESSIKEIEKAYDLDSFHSERLFCVAGTMTSLAAMVKNLKSFSEDAIDGIEISFSQLTWLEREISEQSPDQLLKTYPFLGKRSQSIVGGCKVARSLCEKIGAQTLIISKAGLRYGTLISGEIDERFKFTKSL